MYKKLGIFCFILFIFAGTQYESAMKIPFISNYIEERANALMRDRLEKELEPGQSGKSSSYDDISGLTQTQQMIVLAQGDSHAPETIFAKLWIAFRCVTMNAEGIAYLPFGLYKFGTDETVEKSAILNMLKGKANERMSGRDVIERMAMHLELRGNAYAFYIGTTGIKGLPISINPLLAQNIKPVMSTQDEDIVLYYRDIAKQKRYEKESIIHSMYLNPNSTTEGLSPLSAGETLTDFSNEVGTYKTELYKNQARPSGVAETDLDLNTAQIKKIRSEITQTYAGSHNAGKVMILDNKLTFRPISFTPRDLELLTSEQTTWSMIPTLYGIPIELFGNLAKQKNYANMREATKHYYQFCLLPKGDRLFRALSMYFFPDMDYEFRILVKQIDALRPSGSEIKDEYWTTPLQKLTMTGGKPPEDEEQYNQLNQLYFPGNLVPAGEIGQERIVQPEEL